MTICLAVGIFLIAAGLVLRIRETIRCKAEVEAECVSVNIRIRRKKNGGRVEVKCPVWRFLWEGRTYFVEDQNGNSMVNYKAGETCILRIDPKNPKHFYRKGMSNAVVTMIFGIAWTVFVLFGMNLDKIMNFILQFV